MVSTDAVGTRWLHIPRFQHGLRGSPEALNDNSGQGDWRMGRGKIGWESAIASHRSGRAIINRSRVFEKAGTGSARASLVGREGRRSVRKRVQ